MKTTPKSDETDPAQRENRAQREAALQETRKYLAEKSNPDKEAFHPYISMYSLTLTVLQLVELYDNQPGKEQRMKVLDELANKFNKLTLLPRK